MLTILLIFFICSAFIFVVYWRMRKDKWLASKLTDELKNYFISQKSEKIKCSVKIYEPDTIVAFSSVRNVYFLEQGILIFDRNHTDIGNKAISVWLYYIEESEFVFKYCQSKGIVNNISDGGKKIIVDVLEKSNYLPFFTSKSKMKYEILINSSLVKNIQFNDRI